MQVKHNFYFTSQNVVHFYERAGFMDGNKFFNCKISWLSQKKSREWLVYSQEV